MGNVPAPFLGAESMQAGRRSENLHLCNTAFDYAERRAVTNRTVGGALAATALCITVLCGPERLAAKAPPTSTSAALPPSHIRNTMHFDLPDLRLFIHIA
ncbi:hypothetical protein FQZ97_1259530 [compost metagenome]